MRFVEMAEAPVSLRGWVTRARKVPVVLTVHGRPAVALTPLRGGDWERLVLEAHPAFRRILEESRRRCKPGQGISTAEMRRRLKQRRLAEAKGSSHRRRAPRPARKATRRTTG